jgi:hypothetical protein
MILDLVAAVEARQPGLLNDSLKVPIIIIFKHLGKVAGRPEFCPIVIDPFNLLEGRKTYFGRRGFFAHGLSPFRDFTI